MSVLHYDEDASKRLLAIYTTPDVEQQREQFLNSLHLDPNDIVLDVGSGPGLLTNGIAQKLGPNGKVYGIDISEYLLELAKLNCRDIPSIEFKYGSATNTEFPDEMFNTLICTQVLEYVDDVDAALNEFHRVLKKGGTVALLDTDWDSIVWNSNDISRMSKILQEWEGHATHPYLPRTLFSRLTRSGFKVEKVKVIPLLNYNYNPNTYSNRIIDLILPYVVNKGTITQQVAEEWAEELRTQKNYFFSLNRYLFTGTRI